MPNMHRTRRAATMNATMAALMAICLAVAMVTAAAPTMASPPSDVPALQRVTLVDLPVSDGANIITSSLTLSSSHPSTALRITLLLKSGATDAKLQPVVTTGGGVSAVGDLNDGTVATAGRWYTWTLGTSKTSTNGSQELSYNFRVSAATTLAYLDIQEVKVP